jgi:DNA repair exonuclease SbcCD nuclease subunit
VRLVLFADVHLDAPFAWADADVARRRRQALRDAVARVVDLTAEVDADALLCAGDLYEHERLAPDTGPFLRQRFAEAGCPVLVSPGNHDWYGRESLYATVRWPDHVHVFTGSRLGPAPLGGHVTVWGAAHRAPSGTGDVVAGSRAEGAGIHLALVHASERAGLPGEARGKQVHAPFDEEAVPAAGFAHALCGHYHRPRAGAWHTYPGNPEPLTFGEDGRRGPVVVDVEPDGTVRREWREVAGTAWHEVEVDVTGCETVDACVARARAAVAGRRGVVRLTVGGELPPQVPLEPRRDLTPAALGAGGDDAPEAVVVRVGELHPAIDVEETAAERTVAGQFVRDVRADPSLDERTRQRVLTVGLRALAGREDLEAG